MEQDSRGKKGDVNMKTEAEMQHFNEVITEYLELIKDNDFRRLLRFREDVAFQ